MKFGSRASSAINATPTLALILSIAAAADVTTSAVRPAFCNVRAIKLASRPTGARTITASSVAVSVAIGPIVSTVAWSAERLGNTTQDMAKPGNGVPNRDLFAEGQHANGLLMRAAAILYHRDGQLNFSVGFKVSKEQDSVCQVADIHHADKFARYQAVLRKHQQRNQPLLIEIRNEFVQLYGEILLSRHGVREAVQAVDH